MVKGKREIPRCLSLVRCYAYSQKLNASPFSISLSATALHISLFSPTSNLTEGSQEWLI